MLKEKYDEMEKLMERHSKFGASDTEPRYHLHSAIKSKLKGKMARIPQDANSWELYSDMAGVEKAAKDLTEKLSELLEVIENAPFAEVKKFAHAIDADLED